MFSKTPTLLAILLALVLGVLIGRIFNITAQPVPPTVLHDDDREVVPVVRIDGITDGQLTGVARGNVRLFLGEQMVIPSGSGSFRASAGVLLKNLTTAKVPVGMHFVASRRGKKYYPAASRSAQSLAPENRVYFQDAAAAEAAGYIPSQ